MFYITSKELLENVLDCVKDIPKECLKSDNADETIFARIDAAMFRCSYLLNYMSIKYVIDTLFVNTTKLQKISPVIRKQLLRYLLSKQHHFYLTNLEKVKTDLENLAHSLPDANVFSSLKDNILNYSVYLDGENQRFFLQSFSDCRKIVMNNFDYYNQEDLQNAYSNGFSKGTQTAQNVMFAQLPMFE